MRRPSGNAPGTGAPGARAVTVVAGKAGLVCTLTRQLGGASTFSLLSGSSANLTLDAANATLRATAALAAGTSQTARLREARGDIAIEYPVTVAATGTVQTGAVWRLASIRAGASAFATSGTSAAAFQRQRARMADRLGAATYQALRYKDAGYWVNSDSTETPLGNAATLQRALEIGGVSQRVTFAGATGITIPSGGRVESDDVLPGAFGASAFAPGTVVWHRSMKDQAIGEALLNYPATGPGSPAGEGALRSTTGTDDLMGSGMLSGGTSWGQPQSHARLVGLATDHGPTVLIVGDSRFYGFGGDSGLGTGAAGGPPCMALEQAGIPHEQQARSATRIAQAVANDCANLAKRLDAVQYVSDIIGNWGTNDLNAGRAAAQVLADIAAFAAKAKSLNPSVRIWWATIAPRTNNQNVPSGAFVAGAANGRDALNAELRQNAGTYGLAGFVDVAAAVESSAVPGTWADYSGDTTDGTHSTQAGQVKECVPIRAWAQALPAPT